PGALGPDDDSCPGCGMAGSVQPARRACAMRKENLPGLIALATWLTACGRNGDASRNYDHDTHLPISQRGVLPSMKIAEPAEWGDQQPRVPDGYRVTAIATDLLIPRQTLVLPNGDILVAEGRGGGAPALKPKDVIAGVIKAKGTTSVDSGNRLTL